MPNSEKNNKANSHFLKGDKGGLKDIGGLAIPYNLNLKQNSRQKKIRHLQLDWRSSGFTILNFKFQDTRSRSVMTFIFYIIKF